ncbi:class D sortase [Clostridium hydrogenum]|uniref:class D sortase n=1 Tax=Clostridium hydrogenum TaxID=2855764 RepID=UPI001F22DCB5|nr:class D sortase [Clostridium hydrogenum]
MGKKLKIFGLALIIIGLAIIIGAFSIKLFVMHKQNTMIKNYEKKIEERKNAKKTDVGKTDDSGDMGVVGLLKIPKIDLKVAIGEGADLETLKFAVGHFKGTGMPGKNGNFCVAGHRSYIYGEYFNRLNELKIGDEITVETLNGEYKYKVYSIQVVLPSHTEVLNPTTDATMTLVTCTPLRVATHRLIVKARLEKSKNLN